MEIKFEIQTQLLPNGVISQEVFSDNNLRDKMQRISHDLYDTREAQIREALIKLGWTPPEAQPQEVAR